MNTPKDSSLSRPERLRGRRRLENLFSGGSSGFVYPFRYVWLGEKDVQDAPPVAVMASAPKKNHKRANKRNTLKRRTKEAYRLNKQILAEAAEAKGLNISLALIYSSKEVERYDTIENAVKKILAQIATKLR